MLVDSLRAVFDAAVSAADPRRVLAARLPKPPRGRVVVVGAGKAAASMAAALEEAWPHAQLEGAVVTRYGHSVPTRKIEVLEAAHPLPDANSERGARRMLECVRGLSKDDLVIALMSGGGSAIMELPAKGLTLEDVQDVNRALQTSGATIHEMNAVRTHISAIKGGRLAQAAAPAHVLTLAISDVPGDDPSIIASGPTVADSSTLDDVRSIVERYAIELPPSVQKYLKNAPETPKDVESDVRIIAKPIDSLRAAAEAARRFGWQPLVLGELGGESRELGVIMADVARSVRAHGLPLKPPAVLISGGETVVTVKSGSKPGRGGRNLEFLLSLALSLDGLQNVFAIAADTDGRDGSEDAAGAMVTPDTLARARAAGLDARAMLDRHDTYSFFEGLDDLVVTGPTLTNVNALRAVVVV